MSNLKNLLSILILFMFTQSYGFSKGFIGVISAGIGDITNQNDEKLSTSSKIFDGDTIFVKEKSNAQILLLDETALTIGEKSELTFDDFVYDSKTKVGKIVSNIKLGTVRIITGEISKQNPDNLNIKVPTGSIGARGTEFAVLTESNNKSTIVLLGPGKNNTLGMIPGVLKVSDGFNSVDLTQPGFQSVVFE